MPLTADASVRKGLLYSMSGLFLLAALSQARVQVFRRDDVLDLAQENGRLYVERTDYAERGSILSSDGRVLAQSSETYELGVNFNRTPQSEGFFLALSDAAGIPATELAQAAATKNAAVVYDEPLSALRAKKIEAVKSKWRADGISLHRTLHRDYPLGEIAALVVGSVRENKPVSGIEVSKNKLLAGENGKIIGMLDRSGAFLPTRMKGSGSAKSNGKNLILTLDAELQAEAMSAAKRAVEKHKAERGIVVIQEPSTGNILALAVWPSEDPTVPGGFGNNAAISLTFEPGSIFKVLTLAKGIDTGAVIPGSYTHCAGRLSLGSSWSIGCDQSHGSGGHGDVNTEMAIAESCNVSAAIWSCRMGETTMFDYFGDLGLLEPTKIGLPAEASGLISKTKYAVKLQTATWGFGQSMKCTPIGLASAFSMLANHGLLMKPRLIESIDGVKEPLRPSGQVVSDTAATEVLREMESVIHNRKGTGHRLAISGYRLAGKSGTAQKRNDKTGSMKGGGYCSNFVGFVPAKHPKAMVLVMIDKPQNGFYGADVAGPAFRACAKAVIQKYQIPADQPSWSDTPEEVIQPR